MSRPPEAAPASAAAATAAFVDAGTALRQWLFVNRVLLDCSRALADGRIGRQVLEEFSELSRHSDRARAELMERLGGSESHLPLALRTLELGAGDGRSARADPSCDTGRAMDSSLERQHLEIADRHIAEARPRIAAQEDLIASGRLSGAELDNAMLLLRSMHRTLAEFEEHRRAIFRLLQTGDSGHA